MKIYVYKKGYNKESKEIRTAILDSVEMLNERIRMYELQGIGFNRIFNDDKVKYDKHGKFFTFKCQKSNVQLRILYAYFVIKNEPTYLIADYFVKKKNKKDYIRKFDSANTWDPLQILNLSFIASGV